MSTETISKQKITPYLWFDDQAEEAANAYVSLFSSVRGSASDGNASKIGSISRYGEAGAQVSGKPGGTVMTVEFQLAGQKFVALNGGPEFNFTPAISFFVSCETEQEIDELWQKLSDGGDVLMPLATYPFSEKFGWLNDKYGLSWQMMLAGSALAITPFLMFVGEQQGKAEEAVNFYRSLFENSSVFHIERYGENQGEPEGSVLHARFSLGGQQFMAMDSSEEHDFTFTEAISFLVNCETQEEVDELWEKFTADGEEGPCGWLKDPYGVSWQIIPAALTEMLADKDAGKAERAMKAMLKMKKIDIEGLRKAYMAG
jgi:predicted 3-demethylubiquinone-9 3-methyltransferase (glyoxalase superfamily)